MIFIEKSIEKVSKVAEEVENKLRVMSDKFIDALGSYVENNFKLCTEEQYENEQRRSKTSISFFKLPADHSVTLYFPDQKKPCFSLNIKDYVMLFECVIANSIAHVENKFTNYLETDDELNINRTENDRQILTILDKMRSNKKLSYQEYNKILHCDVMHSFITYQQKNISFFTIVAVYPNARAIIPLYLQSIQNEKIRPGYHQRLGL